MINERIINRLGATKVVKRTNGFEGATMSYAKAEYYNNNMCATYESDFTMKENMEVEKYVSSYKLYKDGKIIFSWDFCGDENEMYKDLDREENALEKTVKEMLTPCKPSKNKIERLAKMTIENGCTCFEALTAKILMNKLIFRSNLSI